MLLSAVSVLVVTQSSSEIPEGLMNNPVYRQKYVCGGFRKRQGDCVSLDNTFDESHI